MRSHAHDAVFFSDSFFDMAKQAVFSVLSQLGCEVAEGGAIEFAKAFLSDRLRDSFGVFAFDGRVATYRMLPLAQCENYGRTDPEFFRAVQTAKQAVERGEGIAIVVASIVRDDAYTQLIYMPRRKSTCLDANLNVV